MSNYKFNINPMSRRNYPNAVTPLLRLYIVSGMCFLPITNQNQMTTKTVISKSKKRKMTTVNKWSNGLPKIKANDFTEMVVYKTKMPDGKYTSVTKHEKVR